ncbi:class I SAM-dependent methyltransferase [Paenibacillus qinlingensis]|uniref:2-polyprenyl-3-methyl-5-hydroxy-6-metoxy-1, 4-benzoquinol methylase n=1 Tax=Paenibacillus qinlingensis TaxID=1837343 RepID=A0ABU1NZ43_9BACL|nr:class I SAM-dependent methyltransferase [Paenibacillus qinlingensis]MDR6552287.1 2-polyprenyl-3-methyl-5-hydroxy-6-metoxy-1,4-benzoquinol methylase [Paenibacillus qinlingensis]
MQKQLSTANKMAWETKAYQAWVQHFGTPEELAAELKLEHKHHLRYWLKYMGDPAGKRVLNLLGSHGRKAISLALLGAEVTVVDISEENRLYAMQVAAATGVQIDYICSDALDIPNEETLGQFDIVLMEFGVLHYFTDLHAIFSVVQRRLRNKGRFILTDFHPFARAWLNTYNLPEPTGNYFEDRIKEGQVAFAKLLPEEERSELRNVLVRSWTVGEIITAISAAGLCIRTFEEIASKADPRFPEFYTLIADRIDVELSPLYP